MERGLFLVALLFLSHPAFAAPRPALQTTPPAGVAKTEDSDAQHRTLNEEQRTKARFNLDFDKQDINEVVRYIAQWTGKDFIMGDNVRGKITILCPTPVTADEAFNAFVAALKTNALQITPTGKFFKIEGMKDSVRSPLPICTTEHCPFALNEQMVTKVFHTKYNEAESLKAVLTQFISREGELDVFPPDILILSDTVINVSRIENILHQVDQPLSTDEINVVQLLHAPAQELSATLTQIFAQQGAGGGAAAAGASGRKPIMNSKEGNPNAPVVVTKILPDERSNRLIIIAQAKAFERVRELINKLDVATDAGQVHVYYLENADAEELSATLSQIASGAASSKGKSKTGSTAATPATPAATPASAAAGAAAGQGALFTGDVKVSADKATNSLLIVASPHDYRNMLKVIDKLDIRRRQVFIEAVIMEVKLNDSNTLNIDLHGGGALQNITVPGAQNGIAPILIGSEESGAAASLSIASLASLTGFLAGIQGPPITVNGLNITLPAFGVILNALQTNSDVNVISTPCLLTSDNGEAEISVGQTVPFRAAVPTGLGGLGALAGLAGGATTGTSALGGLGGLGLGLGGFAPITRVPVELRLKIKPHINESDYVKLEIDEQVENIASVDQTLGPTTAKRAVKTTVFAKDQTSVVIGGLIQEQTTHSETRTPILGEIPVIGALFRSDLITRDKTNLLLFLTPYIIRDQADFRAIFERKLHERQEFVARYFGAEDQYQVKVDYEHKHGPLSVMLKGVKEEFARVENGGAGVPGQVVYPGSTPPGVNPQNPPSNVAPVDMKVHEPEGTHSKRNEPEPELPPSSLGPLPANDTLPPMGVTPPPSATDAAPPPPSGGEAAPAPPPEAPAPAPAPEAPPPPPPVLPQ